MGAEVQRRPVQPGKQERRGVVEALPDVRQVTEQRRLEEQQEYLDLVA